MRSPHIQTIYPFVFRKVKGSGHESERVELLDGDFLDLDFYNNESETLIIICHGLEGSSSKPYSKGLAQSLFKIKKYDVIAWNMRSCSKDLNRLPTFYHGAQSEDIDNIIEHAKKKREYKNIILVGFSLGGNLVSYYAGKVGKSHHHEITASIAISATLDLESSIHKLSSSQSGKFYSEIFLATMRKKTLAKIKSGLLQLNPIVIKKCKNFIDFDQLVTAPTFGFSTAQDYYHYASAINHIEKVDIPLYLIQAQDDPFLCDISYPRSFAHKNENIYLEIPKHGGHVGFIKHKKKISYWAESRVQEIIGTLLND